MGLWLILFLICTVDCYENHHHYQINQQHKQQTQIENFDKTEKRQKEVTHQKPMELSSTNVLDKLQTKQQYKDQLILYSIYKSLEVWKQSSTHNVSNDISKLRRNEEIVCYRRFGCFRNEAPFDYLDALPASPDIINTTFILYTRTNKPQGEILSYTNSTTLHNSSFKAKSSVKIIIHGFGSKGTDSWVLQMMEALLFADDLNVIIVDWKNGAALPNYLQAAANTQLVGKEIALFIKWIIHEKVLTANDFHLIGFSLGAHIAGFTGTEIKNISRITGLDPAAPLFEGYDPRVRLDANDALFVDIIHSNGDSFLRGGLGSFNPMGHVDFYPNGGRNQVGCNNVFIGAINDMIYGKWQSLCHHRRAFRFFIDSIVRTCTFNAFSCENYKKFLKGDCFQCGKDGNLCANMGYFADRSSGRGKMYLVTRKSEPFCANQYKIQIFSSSGQGSTFGKLQITFVAEERNETFQLTGESDEIKDGALIQGLVVAHPTLNNITHAIIKYTKYRGWIYSGKDFLGLDQIILTKSDSEILTYCGFNTLLENNLLFQVKLDPGMCSVKKQKLNKPTPRLSRFVWRVVTSPVMQRTPKLLSKFSLKDENHTKSSNIYTPISDKLKYFWEPSSSSSF